jgi:pilus assembly protein CpaC
MSPRSRMAALAAALSAAAFCQPAAPVAAAPKIVTAAGAPLMVDVGKGQLVTLDRPATTVFVADPEIADVQVKSPSLIYLFGKKGGETTLFAVGENDQVLANLNVRVRYDTARVQEAIHQMVPHSAISVNALDGSLVLEGTVYSAADGDDVRRVAERFVGDPKQLVNKMKVDTPNQVNLRVRVAEVSRNVVKAFGINWNALFRPGKIAFGVAQGRDPGGILSSIGPSFATRAAVPGAAAADTVNNLVGEYLSGPNGTAAVDTVIDALDKNGLITVLAEPNLTAISGEPASFLVGGEYPIPVSGSLGQIGLEFKKFGVSLSFVSTIGVNNRINIHVQPEVSELDPTAGVNIGGLVIPGLAVRRAETTLDMASGQSFAIGGLLQNNVKQSISKFPWLGDVPVLGQLFRSEAFQRNETELVIIVTPYIVRPVTTANRLLAPTDGLVTSSDAQFVLYGNQYRQQAPRREADTPVSRAGGSLIGPVGFELD